MTFVLFRKGDNGKSTVHNRVAARFRFHALLERWICTRRWDSCEEFQSHFFQEGTHRNINRSTKIALHCSLEQAVIRKGWASLESVPAEMDEVEGLLQEQGFEVTRVVDPNAEELSQSFKSFIDEHGLEKDNRLLFFFSGHGYTRNNGKKGYLVPVDAPSPISDLKLFLRKALGMHQILAWGPRYRGQTCLISL